MSKTLLLATTFAIASAVAPAAAQQQVITLARSQAYVATSDQPQHFSESIDLNKGQEKLNLTLTYHNGSETAPGFKWLRVSSSSMSYITEQQFMGRKTLSVDVTGELGGGGNQVLVSAGGPKGAAFSWELTTPQPHITGIKPERIAPGGTATILGTNLCPSPSANVVTIGGAPAQCISATADSLVVQVPDQLKDGGSRVDVKGAGLDCGTVACDVFLAPHLTSLSNSWCPAGAPLTINGQGFGSDPSKIAVFIGPLQVPVDAATANSITVTIPGSYQSAWAGFYMPVKVIVGGVKATNQLTVSCAVTAPTGGY